PASSGGHGARVAGKPAGSAAAPRPNRSAPPAPVPIPGSGPAAPSAVTPAGSTPAGAPHALLTRGRRTCWAARPAASPPHSTPPRPLAPAARPATVEAWLPKSAAPAILHDLAGKKLTHRALDEIAGGKPAEHLRAVLVALGTLPARDEQLSRLERWTAWVIAE